MSKKDFIRIRGARTNNLKNINIDIPKDELTVITGLSGSGKSSLAFDTLYAEGQRRYVESLSAYARQFLGLMDKPDVDLIEGLQPAISIDQKSTGHNPRSTVGTVTEIYDYLRLLFARTGHPRSPVTGRKLEKQTVQQIVDKVLNFRNLVSEDVKIQVISPIIKDRKGTYEELFNRFLAQGFVRVRVDGNVFNLEEEIKLDRYVKHNIDLIIDRLVIKEKSKNDKSFKKRLTDSIELALNNGDGEIYINIINELNPKKSKSLRVNKSNDIFFSEKLVDPETGESFPEIEPHSFSFNSPHGACSACNGLGTIKEIDETLIYNPRLTVMEGGIYPWNRIVENENSFTLSKLRVVSEAMGIDLRTPIGKLPKNQLKTILYGSGNKKFKGVYTTSKKEEYEWNSKYEGIIPTLLRRYNETDSDYIRKEIEQYMIEQNCPTCKGYRLKNESLAVTISGNNIVDVTNLSIKQASDWVKSIYERVNKNILNESILEKHFNFSKIDPEKDFLTDQEKEIGKQIFKEIEVRLDFLLAVGLEYLTLSRTARTLSGGEAQRIRLASQIGTGLTGVLYVLDEPSIGLHQRDNERLIQTLENLRDIGNTVVVVEHDEDTIKKANYVIDIGPGAGEHGGGVVAVGSPKDVVENTTSLTGRYLSGKKRIEKKKILKELKSLDSLGENYKSKVPEKSLVFTSLKHNNLKGFDLEIPLGKMVCVTGVSGSGKSSTINEIVYPVLAKHIYNSKKVPGEYGSVKGLEYVDKVINIDQSPIGKTPRSNPATYTGVFTQIREIFSQTKEARARGYKPGRFSFNVKGGRCEKCQGAGVIQISMQFLPDVYVTCDECKGERYNRETLQIDYKGKNISEVLNMTVEEGVPFFENIISIKNKLQTLLDVGLGYIRLGQAATTLSGGESQRVKLSSELAKRSTGKTVYILDEPTTGLHFEDVRKLLLVLHGLVLKGNTVIVIEHNLDVIKTADYIIDLGPEGGDKGGNIVALGSPEEVMNTEGSYTGKWLSKVNGKN